MNQLRAFVGHSFTPEDEGVVNAFLKYFGQLENVLPCFQWTNARAAEPIELAGKVLSLVEGKNVFIGICTKKERVIADSKLRQAMFGGDLRASASDFQWKTSDWIIQEIGLAIGKDMSIILLLEEGCRKPGGLQGDVEFIPFDRTAPERAFGQLLEMIKALSPSTRPLETATTEAPVKASDDVVATTAAEDLVPDETWDRTKYEHAFALKIMSGHSEAASEIAQAYLRTPEAQEAEKQGEWHSSAELWKVHLDNGGRIERLRELANEYPNNSAILSNLAAGYARFDHHADAAAAYLAAAKASSDATEANKFRGRAAIEFYKDGDIEIAESQLDSLRLRVWTNPDEELTLLYQIKEIAEWAKDDALATQVLERVVDLRPDDSSARFDLAYKYSQLKYDDLALHHYLLISPSKRDPSTWNNLGVAFEQASLQGKAIDAYRRAASEGETLAMSNLAYRMMSVGLLAEANEQLQKALQIADYHRNVPEALTHLRDFPKKENDTLEEVRSQAKPKIDFFKSLSKAVSQPTVSISSSWEGPECELTLIVHGRKFSASGQFVKEYKGLSGALTGLTKKTTYTVTYTGQITGCRIFGTVKKKSDGNELNFGLLSGLSDDGTPFAMYIHDDGQKISSIENPSSNSPRYYDLIAKGSGPEAERLLTAENR